MTDLPRYLIYPVDKHQSSPWFLDELRATDIADNDESLDVIVDLWTGQRMFLGQWAPIDGWRKSDVSARLQQLETSVAYWRDEYESSNAFARSLVSQSESRSTDGDVLPIAKGPGDGASLPSTPSGLPADRSAYMVAEDARAERSLKPADGSEPSDSHQQITDPDEAAGIMRGIADARAGRTRSLREIDLELESEQLRAALAETRDVLHQLKEEKDELQERIRHFNESE